MIEKGNLIVFSGFSGSGKGTIMKELLRRYPMQYGLSISATTRNPRVGEIDGREYFFKTREEFEQLIETDAFIEHAEYVGNYYGTPKDYVEKVLEEGRDVILEIEMQGALQVKKKLPDTLLMFVTPPSVEILRERLVGRGTEELEVIERRIEQAASESKIMDQYDYLIVNDDLDECVECVHQIIQAQHYLLRNNMDFVNEIKKEFK